MSDLSNDERLDRLETAFNKKSIDDAAAFEALNSKTHEIIVRVCMLQSALQNEIAIQLANDTVENSKKYKADFINCLNNDWTKAALSGAFLGGSEKREHELLKYVREISQEFIDRLSWLEAMLRAAPAADNESRHYPPQS